MRQDPFRRLAPPDSAPGAWRLEHKIPLALIGALILQCAGIAAWATSLEARLQTVERAQAEQTGLSEKFARLDERIDALRGDIARLSRQVEKIGR